MDKLHELPNSKGHPPVLSRAYQGQGARKLALAIASLDKLVPATVAFTMLFKAASGPEGGFNFN